MPSTELEARTWLTRLERRQAARRPDIDLREEYYAGQHRLAFATAKFQEAFGSLFTAFADNWCDLVVDAAVERLVVEGFRFGANEGADDAAAAIWQANGLDVQSTIGHRTAGTCGEAYALVAPANPAESGHDEPIITIEHPAQFIVDVSPVNPRLRRAALKVWDDDGRMFANVYLPDAIWRFRGAASAPVESAGGPVQLWTPSSWSGVSAGWELIGRVRNTLGVVPGIPLINKPDAFNRGRSDIAQVIPVQDAINKLFTDLLVNSEFVAFPQRWATGIEPQFDEAGNELDHEQFKASVARMWVTGADDAKFGQLVAGDPSWFVRAIEMAVQHVAARTRTPPHYLLGQSGAFPSGESLKSTETGLVAKCEGKQTDAGECWEETMRLAFLHKKDDVRARDLGAETIWRDAESRTDAERADALSKYKTMGVPDRFLWEKSGLFTAKEIERMAALQEEERKAALTLGLGGFNPDPNAQNVPNGQ